MIELSAEKILYIGGFHGIPITNSFFSAILVSIFLVGTAYLATRSMKVIPGTLQNIVEYIIEFLYSTALETVGGDENRARQFFPLVATFFLFILFANWSGLLPIFNTIGFFSSFSHTAGAFTPLLRPINSDLNITLSMAIISVIATQYFAIKNVGIIAHLGRYFSLNPIYLFVGILEIVSELTKVISLSLRLYGNILAGDTVISTFTSLVGYIVPLPFMGLELVVGIVQAAVFAMLTLAFTSILTEKHSH